MRYSPGRVDVDTLHVRVFHGHESDIGPWWNERGVRSSFWRYYVHSSDGAAVRVAGARVPLPARQVHFLPPWMTFDLLPPARRLSQLYVHFDIVGLPASLVAEAFPRPRSFPFDAAMEATAATALAALGDARAGERPSALFAIKTAIDAGLVHLFADLPDAAAARIASVTRADSPIAPALRRIDERLGEPFSVPGLAALCGYAPDHFTRVFRKHVGQSPAQYVLDRRVAVAAQRLVLGDEPIEAIAAACGFPDRFYFSRVFTRRIGMPPAAYRRAEPRLPTRAAS